jgi:hypothetical protein
VGGRGHGEAATRGDTATCRRSRSVLFVLRSTFDRLHDPEHRPVGRATLPRRVRLTGPPAGVPAWSRCWASRNKPRRDPVRFLLPSALEIRQIDSLASRRRLPNSRNSPPEHGWRRGNPGRSRYMPRLSNGSSQSRVGDRTGRQSRASCSDECGTRRSFWTAPTLVDRPGRIPSGRRQLACHRVHRPCRVA